MKNARKHNMPLKRESSGSQKVAGKLRGQIKILPTNNLFPLLILERGVGGGGRE